MKEPKHENLDLIQGSEEWQAARAKYFTASEALGHARTEQVSDAARPVAPEGDRTCSGSR